ncbi:type VII secretion-associated serine protease mycosin [Jidongwangia harbinensis]|uniref:type VII secretion-associated serine protease mycosin n=1 Tax=Jidongwangia harbinensis TaxID=2878561 RepID=UPI001CD9A813|nr:type VII secretion-associated serine protease mycosin [Jidongwangia harbinensis]MCA2214982.1 type VII secretion-associated serine protease mycosin [Jidongwangia harbinensis]
MAVRAAAAVAVLAVLGPAVPAQARVARCDRPPAPAAVRTAVPAEVRRFDVPSLAALATGAGVRVAVVDSGVDAAHPQLRGRVAAGRDFLRGGPGGREDCVGHGTGVASVIAAAAVDGTGFQGLAPGATIVPVRISEQEQIDGEAVGAQGSAADFARAIVWAADPAGGDAQVINLSLAMTADDAGVRRAVARAVAAGVVVVAAVGNRAGEGNPTPYPAAYPGVIGVGAVAADGTRSEFSQRGRYVDLVAPGAGVTVAAPGSGHRPVDGTSYAAPFVAGAAALVRERFPRATPEQVARRLFATADPAPGGGRSAEYGFGVVNPYRALTETLGPLRERSPEPAVVFTDDPAAVAVRARRDAAQRRALLLAGGGVAGMVLAVVVAGVWRGGRRRGWRAAGQGVRAG